MRRILCLIAAAATAVAAAAATPVTVVPVTAPHGMVVAGHPEAARIGVAILKAGGNAIDAAVATSLAAGVAEPYSSGLGGKLMLVYYEAKTGQTFAVDAMDAAGSLDVAAYARRPEEDRSYGYGAVCVPGLPAGLWAAHQRWGVKPWAEDVRPAVALARGGFDVLDKTRDLFAEQEKKLRRGDAEIARLYLQQGRLPAVGSRLANEDLARTLEVLAEQGRDGFYRGPIARAIVAASSRGGGVLTLGDFAKYEAHITAPIAVDFRGYHLVGAPPPASGPAFFMAAMKVVENESFGSGPLRTADNLDLIGRAFRVTSREVWRTVGDMPDAPFQIERLLAPDAIAGFRRELNLPAAVPPRKVARRDDEPFFESAMAATTHFVIVDAEGNIVTATQSQSLHFGAGVVPPGTGIVLNDSMSNFNFTEPAHANFVAPGKRPRSTIGPTIVFQNGKPVLALGIPGAARIPTALLQVLLDRLALQRPLADAIGDTRVHYATARRSEEADTFEAEKSFPTGVAAQLAQRGWKIALPEEAGRGRHFGGINAVEINADGSLTGFADPRRTNAAMGY
jgi:gamma-glutamyltranspeptidase/glutathione hydrolase